MNKYPDGKLSDSDEGQIKCEVGDFKGRVVMRWPKPIAAIAMRPQEAIDLAEMLIRRARKVTTEPITINLGGKK